MEKKLRQVIQAKGFFIKRSQKSDPKLYYEKIFFFAVYEEKEDNDFVYTSIKPMTLEDDFFVEFDLERVNDNCQKGDFSEIVELKEYPPESFFTQEELDSYLS